MAEVELRLKLEAEVEERPDRWAIYSREFCFYAYGKTREEANEDFYDGVMAILNCFETSSAIADYFDGRKVDYSFVVDGKPVEGKPVEDPLMTREEDPVAYFESVSSLMTGQYRSRSIIVQSKFEEHREVKLVPN